VCLRYLLIMARLVGFEFCINDQNSCIQQQMDKVNCGYFTCWYAQQLVTNESIDWFGGDYEVAMIDIRENIMCSIIKQQNLIGDDKQKTEK
jgi:hypothetical protein